MKTLALHLDCLRELDRDEQKGTRKLSRIEALGFIAGATVVAFGLAASVLLEDLVLERLGLR